MICEKFNELTPIEKVILVGKLVHAIQSDNECFGFANKLVEVAELKGLYVGVKILPENEYKTDDDSVRIGEDA